MSQTLPIWENYLVIFVCPRIYLGICLPICPEFCSYWKNINKSWSPIISIVPTSWSWTWRKFRDTMKPYPSCRTSCKLFIHEVFFEPLGLHLRVWSELGRSPPFQPMRALRLQWSHAFNLCVKWPWGPRPHNVSVLLTSISEFVLLKSDRLPKWPVGGVIRPKLYFVSVVWPKKIVQNTLTTLGLSVLG